MLDMIVLPVVVAIFMAGLVWWGLKKGKFRTYATRERAVRIEKVI
jgi:nitrogen fixation-related uncharacterized protein